VLSTRLVDLTQARSSRVPDSDFSTPIAFMMPWIFSAHRSAFVRSCMQSPHFCCANIYSRNTWACVAFRCAREVLHMNFSSPRREGHSHTLYIYERKTSGSEPTSTDAPANGDKPENVHTAPDGTKDRGQDGTGRNTGPRVRSRLVYVRSMQRLSFLSLLVLYLLRWSALSMTSSL
jgi:hypothetical protein